jgi:hypothetical protein
MKTSFFLLFISLLSFIPVQSMILETRPNYTAYPTARQFQQPRMLAHKKNTPSSTVQSSELTPDRKLYNALWLYHRPEDNKLLLDTMCPEIKTYTKELALRPTIDTYLSALLINLCQKKSIVDYMPIMNYLKDKKCFKKPSWLPFITELVAVHYSPEPTSSKSLQQLAQAIDPTLVVSTVEVEVLKKIVSIMAQQEDNQNLKNLTSQNWFIKNLEFLRMALDEYQEYCSLLQRTINNDSTSILDCYIFSLKNVIYRTLDAQILIRPHHQLLKIFLSEFPDNQLETATKEHIKTLHHIVLDIMVARIPNKDWQPLLEHLQPILVPVESIPLPVVRQFIKTAKEFILSLLDGKFRMEPWIEFSDSIKSSKTDDLEPILNNGPG